MGATKGAAKRLSSQLESRAERVASCLHFYCKVVENRERFFSIFLVSFSGGCCKGRSRGGPSQENQVVSEKKVPYVVVLCCQHGVLYLRSM